MERILIRAGVAPWAEYNALDVITDKIIGNNTGNLLFANSITRLVATADSRVDFISDLTLVKKQITAQEINENYDRLILPMANAFREDFARKCLKHWTALIRQLTIPVTVTGIGIQLPYEPHLEQPREFDGAARDFIAAVLDHSASVGVRGQITYDYLKGLGFSQIDVTGCPSLALNGPGLPLREKQPLTPESKLCFTGSVSNPPDFKKFAVHCTERFPNTYFVPQFIDDLRLMYLGIPHPDTADSRVLHPTNLDHPVFVEDKARFFINLPSMFAFNREMDFNYGTRIHGAIGNILCGVPSLLFPTDARIRELAEYHNIPAIPASAVTPDTDLAALYDQTDFRQVNNGHAERFWHLIDFLNENGIKTIYDDRTGTPARSLYDEKTAATSYAQPVHSMLVRPPEEIARRVDTAVRLQRKEIEDDSRLATQLRDSQRKVTQLQERNKKQDAQIQALKEERKALKAELKATKKPLRRLAWYQAHLHLWHWSRPPEKEASPITGERKINAVRCNYRAYKIWKQGSVPCFPCSAMKSNNKKGQSEDCPFCYGFVRRTYAFFSAIAACAAARRAIGTRNGEQDT